ncbi:MAG: sodium:solute symporter [Kiritimatiellae bacterium]|nr:sodium:solute symporter [Kiritimatiellia bacterium]
MNQIVINSVLLGVYFAVLLAIGWACRRKATDVNGFVLGGRSVGPWLTAFAFGTSYFSAVVFVGYAGQFGWRYGISATWAGIGNALIGSLMAWDILGRRTRIMTQHLDSATMPDFFAKRFGSPALKLAAAAIIFVFLIPYTASLYNGLSRLFGMAFSIDYAWCIVLMSVLTAIYVIAGGYMATAINDFIQGLVMLVGISAIVWAILASKGGLIAALDGLARMPGPAMLPGGEPTPGIFTSFFGPDPLNLLFVVILTSLGTWGLPQMVQKFYAIKDEGSIKKGTIISTLFAFVVAGGCYFLGGFGRLFTNVLNVGPNGNPAGGFDAIIPKMLEGLSPMLLALTVVLVLSASMSTLSSLVITSASTFTIDFVNGTVVKQMSDRKQVLCIRSLIVVFIAISAALALVQYKSTSPIAFIAQMMGVSWGAMAGAFLAPFLYSLYSKWVTAASCWACFILAPAFTLAGVFFRDTMPALLKSPINTGALAMLGGLVIVPLVSLFSRKPPKELVDGSFACYEKTAVVPQSTALGAETQK